MVMRIRELREAREMTQGELAERMGVDRTGVNKWESEVALPRARQLPQLFQQRSLGVLPQLAEVLGCSISELFEDPGETGPVSA